MSASIFEGMKLTIPVRTEKLPWRRQLTSQALLDGVAANSIGQRNEFYISLCARSSFIDRSLIRDEPTSVRLASSRYAPDQYANLIVNIPSLERFYVLVIDKESIASIDALFAEHRGDDDVYLEINTITTLLDHDGRSTRHSYKSSIDWPLSKVLLRWVEIEPPPPADEDQAD